MNQPEGPGSAATLESRVRAGATAPQIADEIAATWGEIERALAPVVGVRGFAALYCRSLLLTARVHPWLAQDAANAQASVDLPALTAALAQQTPQEAARAGGAVLQTFHGLVAGLIGASLTRRLLPCLTQTLD